MFRPHKLLNIARQPMHMGKGWLCAGGPGGGLSDAPGARAPGVGLGHWSPLQIRGR